MPLFKYKSINKLGKTIRGQITAANEVDLENRLSDIGLDIIDYKEVSNNNYSFGSKISARELILFCIQLEQLEKAGVPLLDSLSDLRDTAESQKMKNLMSDVTESVKNGSVLSSALGSHPEIFDEVFIGLIAAGEKTGQLHTVFFHLAAHLKWVHEIRSKIKKASTYPIFLLTLMCGIIALMMLFVIPKLSNFLNSQSFELPIYTKALIATSNFMQGNWYYVFFGPILLFFAVRISCKFFPLVSHFVDHVKLSLPVFGPLIRKIEMARFCRFFAITYRSGIGILDCLDISSNVIKNQIIRESVIQARNSVYDGVSLTASLRGTGHFPSLVVRMIKVGEDGGNLDETLESVNFFYDKEVNDTVNSILGMIQPALTIIMGGLMFWVTVAVFGPLYSSFSKMNF
jgi:type IV pilus assembly protein PilC